MNKSRYIQILKSLIVIYMVGRITKTKQNKQYHALRKRAMQAGVSKKCWLKMDLYCHARAFNFYSDIV